MESYQEPDYKELYFSLFRASEKAIRILIQAQQECEEQVLSAGETDCSPEKKRRLESSLLFILRGMGVRR